MWCCAVFNVRVLRYFSSIGITCNTSCYKKHSHSVCATLLTVPVLDLFTSCHWRHVQVNRRTVLRRRETVVLRPCSSPSFFTLSLWCCHGPVCKWVIVWSDSLLFFFFFSSSTTRQKNPLAPGILFPPCASLNVFLVMCRPLLCRLQISSSGHISSRHKKMLNIIAVKVLKSALAVALQRNLCKALLSLNGFAVVGWFS